MATAKTTVPTPTTPPSAQPIATTVTSSAVRTSQIGWPVRACRPVISPSRGPGPKCAPIYRPVAIARISRPAAKKMIRSQSGAPVGISQSPTSADGPTSSALRIVPMP